MCPTSNITFDAAMRKGAAALLISLPLALVGCSSNPIGPSNQPEIANNTDNFQFQASNLSGTTQTLTYSWTNTGAVANVNQSGAVTGGVATLVVRDGTGRQVYSGSLTTTGTFVSASGAAGTWQIDVQLTNATGTVNFRVQRAT